MTAISVAVPLVVGVSIKRNSARAVQRSRAAKPEGSRAGAGQAS